MRRPKRTGTRRTTTRLAAFQTLEPRIALTAQAVGDPLQVNGFVPDPQLAEGQASVAASAAGYAVVYEGRGPVDRQGVYLRRYDAEGVAVGDPVRVNTTVRGAQHSAAVAMADDGSAVVVWAGRGIGDKAGVFLQRYDASGAPVGEETLVNTVTGGVQTDPSVAVLADGSIVVAWHGALGDDAVGVGVRRFTAAGAPAADAARVNSETDNDQQNASVASMAGGGYVVGWQSRHQDGDDWGVYAQRYTADGVAVGDEARLSATTADSQSHLSLATGVEGGYVAAWQSHSTGSAGWDVVARPFGADGAPDGDETPLASETDGHQTGVAVSVADDGQWLVAWNTTPSDTADRRVVARAFEPGAAGADALSIAAGTGVSISAANESALVVWSGSTPDDRRGVAAQRLSLDLVDNGEPAAPNLAAVADREAPEGIELVVELTATDANPRDTLTFTLDADNSPAGATIESTGPRTAVVRWTPPAGSSGQTFGFRVLVTDDGEAPLVDAEDFEVTVGALDTVALAQALADADAQFFGAGWCPVCTEQKERFGDGAPLLPFVEVTNPDRTPNDEADENEVTEYPTWVFADGTRLVGLQSLTDLARAAGVTPRVAEGPSLAAIEDATLLVGSPLHVSLDGFSPDGRPLTYTVQSDNTEVTAEVLSGNRSLRLDVAGYGDMVFELFEQRAPRATDRVIQLAEDGFYEDIIFHRVINNFVIQGGDPTGTGRGGSDLGDFDDQFHPDLQHNRSGLLSYAKSFDDTNDSQFFITEGENSSNLRNLDFNHTVFGVLVEGEGNRAAISDTATGANDRPTNQIAIERAEVFTDTENAVLFLKAADGATGAANITVTVADADGNTFQRTFRVDLAADTVNNRPYLEDLPPVTAAQDTTATFRLSAIDVEGDPVFFSAAAVGANQATVSVDADGEVSVTPPDGFVGTVNVEVRVARSTAALPNNAFSGQLEPDVQVVPVTFS